MVKIGNVPLDNGMPKICVPIVGRSLDELVQECRYLKDKIYDVVELRIDFLKDVLSLDAVGQALTAVRQELPDEAILFTFRTKAVKRMFPKATTSLSWTILSKAVPSMLWTLNTSVTARTSKRL